MKNPGSYKIEMLSDIEIINQEYEGKKICRKIQYNSSYG
jgi:hypothetical protein